jgi:hypothetical protein
MTTEEAKKYHKKIDIEKNAEIKDGLNNALKRFAKRPLRFIGYKVDVIPNWKCEVWQCDTLSGDKTVKRMKYYFDKINYTDGLPVQLIFKPISFKGESHFLKGFSYLFSGELVAIHDGKEIARGFGKQTSFIESGWESGGSIQHKSLLNINVVFDGALLSAFTNLLNNNYDKLKIISAEPSEVISKAFKNDGCWNYQNNKWVIEAKRRTMNESCNINNTKMDKNKSIMTSDKDKMDMKDAKANCISLGFKPKTEKFGECVLQLTGN